MGTVRYFLEAPDAPSEVLGWFRALDAAPEETPTDYGMVLYFRGFGPLVYDETGAIDAPRSPVVILVLPKVRRGTLWTVGELHFTSALHLDRNKSIRNIARSFSKWLERYRRAYDPTIGADNAFAYYLEGSSKNWGPVFALPSGEQRLRSGGYFVSHEDNEVVLDKVCHALRLRGVACEPNSTILET